MDGEETELMVLLDEAETSCCKLLRGDEEKMEMVMVSATGKSVIEFNNQ